MLCPSRSIANCGRAMQLQHSRTLHTARYLRYFAPCKPNWQHTRLRCSPAHATAVDHLVMTVDGFNAAKATASYPALKQLDQESVEPALGVVQGILPARILGNMLTAHPQLLSVDMTAWVEFLTAFGFDESNIQELLRSSPEVFYNSNVFQVSAVAAT